jgi:predicted nucleic-acid-binding protein
MIGLDTNVLIRYIVRDDAKQAAAATRLIEFRCTTDSPGLVNPIVLCELVWVLTKGYGYGREIAGGVIRRILAVKELQVQNAEQVWRAVRLLEQGKADFADYLIGVSNKDAGAATTFTFDREAAESPLFEFIPI